MAVDAVCWLIPQLEQSARTPTVTPWCGAWQPETSPLVGQSSEGKCPKRITEAALSFLSTLENHSALLPLGFNGHMLPKFSLRSRVGNVDQIPPWESFNFQTC